MNVLKQNSQNTLTLGNKYLLFKQKKIGSEAYGEVYIDQNKKNNQIIAINIKK